MYFNGPASEQDFNAQAAFLLPRTADAVAVGRKAWLFAGFDRGGKCAAALSMLIVSARLNDCGSHARLAAAG